MGEIIARNMLSWLKLLIKLLLLHLDGCLYYCLCEQVHKPSTYIRVGFSFTYWGSFNFSRSRTYQCVSNPWRNSCRILPSHEAHHIDLSMAFVVPMWHVRTNICRSTVSGLQSEWNKKSTGNNVYKCKHYMFSRGARTVICDQPMLIAHLFFPND